MLSVRSIHNISAFTNSGFNKVRYDLDSHRIFATDSEVIISVPVDGNSVPSCTFDSDLISDALGMAIPGDDVLISSSPTELKIDSKSVPFVDDPSFPDVFSAFPESRQQVFIPLSPNAISLIADHSLRCGAKTVWITLNPVGDSEFIQPSGKMMFFYLADEKVVSGVICPQEVGEEAKKAAIAMSDVARSPRESLSYDPPEVTEADSTLSHINYLRKRGYTVVEPGKSAPQQEASEPKVRTQYRGKQPRMSEILRTIASKNDARFRQHIDNDANLAERDKDGNSYMIHAARFGNSDIINMIAVKEPSLIDAPDANGVWTPVMHAIHAGVLQNARCLIANGAEFTQSQKEEMGEDYMEAIESL